MPNYRCTGARTTYHLLVIENNIEIKIYIYLSDGSLKIMELTSRADMFIVTLHSLL